jgi:hypothetical protein
MPSPDRVVVCSEDKWEVVQTPVGISSDAKLCADAEEALRSEHPELQRYPAVIRAKGNGAVVVDLDGIHWVMDRKEGTALKLQVALLDGQEVIAHRDFEKRQDGYPSRELEG